MSPHPDAETWRRALRGDREAFETALEPFHGDLAEAAERQIALRRDTGDLREQALHPTELVGETLVRAFERRERNDADRMGFRAWLLGLQHRALARIVRDEARYVGRKALSLDEEVPANDRQDAVEEALYEFRQPFEVITYEDLIAGSEPIDVEFDPSGNEPLTERERQAVENAGLPLPRREALLLHDELALTLGETAQILDASLKDTAESLNLARASVRERVGSVPFRDDERDATDSYTGDPVR